VAVGQLWKQIVALRYIFLPNEQLRFSSPEDWKHCLAPCTSASKNYRIHP
jgi:hypothetical protein